ncbi:ABC transporter permease subunit [Halomonas sp. YLB-10]|uniref:ABC transporter permease subunit n=1 Tax=Halomonas sp. YLB-10 TaxID=2483111 RepID=UPI000F5E7A68|nr:ABC transporter permease subunit [Halomonas sp. YLB-10]
MSDPSPITSLHQTRQRRDRLATMLITAGGVGVLLAVVAIAVFLLVEVLPLFWPDGASFPLKALWSSPDVSGEPEYRWLPHRLDDAAVPQASLAPLLWGTLEAAAWALVVAIPLALGAAAHSSLYMSPGLRARLKPTLELMEAMPSVVLGFIAGLALGPWVERHLAQSLSMVVVLPAAVVLLALGYRWLPDRLKAALTLRWAALWLIPCLLLLVWLAMSVAPMWEGWWFDGDLRLWVEESWGLDVQARNALIVGLAMGFAVIPGIYALAEDALSDVPRELAEGAQAMGATRWQTLTRVMLPVALPGVFSAIMIGAGRAVGETMIVLMASGNSALMTASPLDGLRSLASSIAIELPEAAPGGSHYRLLLLAALALFAFTFLVNTLAEVVRARLKRRFTRRKGDA